MGNLILIDIGMIVTYALFGIAILGAIIAAFKGLIANPKGARTALIGLFAIVAVVGIAFVLSSGSDVSEIFLEKTETPHSWVRPIGAGLFSFYILFGCAVTTLIGTEIMRPFKK